ncbi:hypothetical protein BKA62DRAFT_612758 [Auriculariales sp. MPI-PUGE-AT-0066]|nr:hypothetical protein BKA62DRAFT_612758 [Auriculariales sp. MPI-PUGE-AT-0066]
MTTSTTTTTTTAIQSTPVQHRRASFGQGQLAPRNSPSPTQQLQPRRVVTPVYHRQNSSTASLSQPQSSPYREAIRAASACLAKEFTRKPPHFALSVWQEVEVRLRALVRLERIWGRSGSGASTGAAVGAPGSAGLSGGEDRERRIFQEALRDGYVLCQLINKFQPGMIQRADAHEDGLVRTSNVTKFLSAAATFGVSAADLFGRDDLLEHSPESLGHVAHTIITLCRIAEQPRQPRSPTTSRGPYLNSGASTTSQPSLPASASASTPNLARRPSSPHVPTVPRSPTAASPTPAAKKRWTPPTAALPTMRSTSPPTNRNDELPPLQAPAWASARRDASRTPEPPTSPRRSASSASNNINGLPDNTPLSSSPSRNRPHLARDQASRLSLASTMATTSKFGTIRTMNTEVTEATSLHPSDGQHSLTKSEANDAVSEIEQQQIRRPGLGGRFTFPSDSGHRGSSDSIPGAGILDLGLLPQVEEEEPAMGRRRRPEPLKLDSNASPPSTPSRSDSKPRITMGKGKWPDDFIGLGVPPTSPVRIPLGRSTSDTQGLHGRRESFGSPTTTTAILGSTPPHRKLSIKASVLEREQSSPLTSTPDEPRPFGARRPSHRSRHSVETAQLTRDITGSSSSSVLLPRDRSERDPSRDSRDRESDSPSPIVGQSSNLRRQSTTTNQASPRASRALRTTLGDSNESSTSVNAGNGRASFDYSRDTPLTPTVASMARGAAVPFPRASGGVVDLGSRPSTADTLNGMDSLGELQPKPQRPVRPRHMSDMPDSTRRKNRPTSFDDGGARANGQRSRYESMVSLGMGSSSTNDLTRRDSMSSQIPVTTLIVREEGKPPMHYQLGNCVGRGQFGAVYRALNLNTGATVAVKRIRLGGLKEAEVEQLMKEVSLVKSLSHPSIVKYEGMLRDDDYLNIVLEWVENGSLGQTLKAFGKLNEKLVASYVVKILEGLHYLHTSHVVHCDLKAANILTTKTGNVKLSDFGVSLNLHAVEHKIDVAGTPNWMAPEVIELKGATYASDIWSLGCTVVELLTGRPPWPDNPNSLSVMFHIVEDDEPPIPEGCSPELEDFLQQCFQKNPSMRPQAEELFEHPWLRKMWEHHKKELRPQDSIPFLRRVSADLHKADLSRHWSGLSNLDIPALDSPHAPFMSDAHDLSSSPVARLFGTPLESEMSLPRAHSFIKTTFAKTMTCQVCHLPIKKNAVVCEECTLICHARCATEAAATCDVRAKLLLFAHYAHPTAAGSADLHAPSSPFPMPATPTGRYLTTPSSPPPASETPSGSSSGHKHSKFPWKRKSGTPIAELQPQTAGPSSSPSQRRSKASDDLSKSRVSLSLTNSSQQSSLRSAVTAADTMSSRHHEIGVRTNIEPIRERQSVTIVEPDPASRSSRLTDVTLHTESVDETGGYRRRHKSRESVSSRTSSKNGCTIQ